MSQKAAFTEKRFLFTYVFVTSLFMLWGVAHSMSDVLNKHFQNVLNVSKADSGLIQLSVFGAYFVMSIPAGMYLKRFGYKSGVILGLGLFAAGTFLFVPAADSSSFTFFRIALFILGCGMATLETVAHPFAAALGDQRTSDRRVNFSQSFNAVGAIIGPAIGSYFLLRAISGAEVHNLDAVKTLYVGLGGFIVFVAIVFFFLKVPVLTDPHVEHAADLDAGSVDTTPGKKLIQHRHFVWAVVAQFFNVAAQAGTWSYFINYGVEKMHLTDERAGYNMTLFMVCMAAGRFVGTYLMKFIAPNRLLAIFAFCSMVACVIIAQSWGGISYGALFSLNFFFSIMFPTIFSLGLKNLGKHTQQASSFISMGVVGGAVMPYFMGKIANYDVAQAYYLPIVCYFVIFLFGAKFFKVKH
ncbi:L-fucose:H+ symporter permease [Pedobacter sp. MC2016-14]|uniref:L-fucose:H+ symporter permease n=1 Tax=Pedobacter sp. MC2016-14 TaxID=2897327 RepID=UPI001E412492|nr:L-fucose:H+ symporter permease [Pedobacter sp. MC2016-14]MCD0487630.1 L-fucose:H+ symporter permease [Pedobacter sp. MC2016-14]